jgi:hypothetical protein
VASSIDNLPAMPTQGAAMSARQTADRDHVAQDKGSNRGFIIGKLRNECMDC